MVKERSMRCQYRVEVSNNSESEIQPSRYKSTRDYFSMGNLQVNFFEFVNVRFGSLPAVEYTSRRTAAYGQKQPVQALLSIAVRSNRN